MIIDLIGYIVLISALTYGISFIYLNHVGEDFAEAKQEIMESLQNDEEVEDIPEKYLSWMVNVVMFWMIPYVALARFKNGG